tara:strand:+ start:1086 stop:1475 length:390 start_codon:yes stop_codon:yes gene_type:complete
MVELQTRTVKKPKSHFTICKEKNFRDKDFEVIKYIDSYRRRSDNELFELNVFNPVLEKYKLKKIYEKMFEEDLDNKSLRRLIRIIELSFNIRIFKISNLIFDRNGKIKKEEYKDSFEYIYSLWQSGKIY